MVDVKAPKFSTRSRLVRYIGEDDRLSGNRPAVTAFEPDPPTADPGNDHLSVNSLEIESIAQIAAYHRLNWQNDTGIVALSEHQIHDYNDAGRKASATILYNRNDECWEFIENNLSSPAYKHRPVKPVSKNTLGSKSHCGVEFVRVFNLYYGTRFARHLAKKGRYHVR
jgi:hypothetical protein